MDSCLFYKSYWEVAKCLNAEQKGIYFECLVKIMFEDIDDVESLTDDCMIKMALYAVKPYIKASQNRYAAAVENGKKGAKYGKLGGRPRKNKEVKEEEKQDVDIEVFDEPFFSLPPM